MLNEALVKKYVQEKAIQILYLKKVKVDHEDLNWFIRSTVRDIRTKVKNMVNSAEDPLVARMEQERGNRGAYFRNLVAAAEAKFFERKEVALTELGSWRSIEFECIFKHKNRFKEFLSSLRAHKLTQRVTVHRDGSLSVNEGNSEGYPIEIVLTYRKGEEALVRQFCALMSGKAYVNKSCGTHVHFDMRHVSEEEYTSIAKRVARVVPALRQMLPASRRDNNYCLEDISDRRKGRDSRYAFVNTAAFEKYQTLEIRGHSGTIEADKILNWIEICETVMYKRIRFAGDKITKLEDLLRVYKFANPLKKYIKARYEKFLDTTQEESVEVFEAAAA